MAVNASPERLSLLRNDRSLGELEAIKDGLFSSDRLSNLSVSSVEEELDRQPQLAGELRHRLSDIWLARRPDASVRDVRDYEHELAVSAASAMRLRRAIERSSYGCFIDWANESFRLHTQSKIAQFRTGPIYTQADADGTQVEFLDYRDVEGQLQLAFRVVVATQDRPLLAAAAAQVIFLNAHPFVDGNGRSARALFNVVLCTGHPSIVHLPLRLFIDRADGGFEIAVRQVELNDDWADLLCFHSAWLRLCRSALDAPSGQGALSEIRCPNQESQLDV